MANKSQVALLKQGVGVWNAWREANRPPTVDLRKADLRGTDLQDVFLHQAYLQEAHFDGANLTGTNFDGADLTGATLTSATLINASLIGANLQEADLTGATLTSASLIGANLTKAHLDGATLTNASLTGSNFTKAHLDGATLTNASLTGSNFTKASLTGTKLDRARLAGAQLVEMNLTNANLTGCYIYGVSVWKPILEGAQQRDLIITPPDEPMITVDDLEIAQFIYLLLNYKKLRNVINSVTERGVLILGRFGGGGLEVLHSVATKLREEKYLPIIFEFDRPTDRNYTETVKTLVGLARFVIVDLSGSSVPQELQATVPDFNIPFVPILEDGRRPHAMFRDFLERQWVVKPPVSFRSTEDLIEKIPVSIIAPAEEKIRERQALRAQVDRFFPS